MNTEADRLSRPTRATTHRLSASFFNESLSKEFDMPKITQEEVKRLFDYREDGNLIRKVSIGNQIRIGGVAGYIGGIGYRVIGINYIQYYSHRLVFLYHHGYIPENEIDHIDRDILNNRIENLREVSRQCNVRNSGNRSTNTSGVKGVCWDKQCNKWVAQIVIDGKNKKIGTHIEFNEAVLHRLAAEQCLNWENCDSSSPACEYAIGNGLIKCLL